MPIKHVSWLLALVAALMIATVVPSASAQESQVPEDNIAAVNGTVISRAEFDREMDRVRQQSLSMGRPLGDSQLAQIKDNVLENLIEGRETPGKEVAIGNLKKASS